MGTMLYLNAETSAQEQTHVSRRFLQRLRRILMRGLRGNHVHGRNTFGFELRWQDRGATAYRAQRNTTTPCLAYPCLRVSDATVQQAMFLFSIYFFRRNSPFSGTVMTLSDAASRGAAPTVTTSRTRTHTHAHTARGVLIPHSGTITVSSGAKSENIVNTNSEVTYERNTCPSTNSSQESGCNLNCPKQ